MKDPTDNKTGELIEPPKRGRGRPKTGNAMTPAERQAKYRASSGRNQLQVTLTTETIE
jgi:hypothetical protein